MIRLVGKLRVRLSSMSPYAILKAKLSAVDALIAVQAMSANARLVHKDPKFDAVDGLKHLRLPCKARSR